MLVMVGAASTGISRSTGVSSIRVRWSPLPGPVLMKMGPMQTAHFLFSSARAATPAAPPPPPPLRGGARAYSAFLLL